MKSGAENSALRRSCHGDFLHPRPTDRVDDDLAASPGFDRLAAKRERSGLVASADRRVAPLERKGQIARHVLVAGEPQVIRQGPASLDQRLARVPRPLLLAS